jgi:two-component system, cell cycle sensor histidine kinase and response regulator CckA
MQVLTRVSRALEDADPERGLQSAQAILAELGIRPQTSEQRAAWLIVTHGARTLALSAHGAPGPEFREGLASVLRLALMRCSERSELQRVSERMALLSAASFEGLMFHVNGSVIDVNQRLAEMLGYEPAELLGDQMMKRCVLPDDVPRVFARLASGFEGEYVITGIRKDGSRFRAELQAKQGKLGEQPVRVAAVRDVTERERTELLLRESETRLRNLAEATFDLTVFSRDGIVSDVVGALETLLGYTREQFIGHKVFDFIDITAAPAVAQMFAEQRVGVYQTLAVSASGEAIPMEVVSVNATLHGAPVRMAALRDLRAAKRLEAERAQLQRDLERSQRLDSLGVLAGGIAHDFNNLLMGVLGSAELLQARSYSADDRQLLQGILDAGRRAASLTAQLLAYAGRKELGPRTPIDLGALLQELRVLFDATLSKKARVSFAIEPDCIVLGNRATLTQVIMNLLTNASDALSDAPGTITVWLRHSRGPDARFARALGSPIAAGECVLLEVIDSGSGMDEATQARIFEPFFTTKERGHGLGLAACIGIVSSHGGAILVESAPGRGSTFAVLLPAHATLPAAAPAERTRTPGANVRVLVVDDEAVVRSFLSEALREQGYEVAAAASGYEALVTLERSRDRPPHVVVLDVTLPDLSGVEVLRRIRAGGWQLPVLLSSGFHDAALALDPADFQGFLVKPYALAQLFEALEHALAAAESVR